MNKYNIGDIVMIRFFNKERFIVLNMVFLTSSIRYKLMCIYQDNNSVYIGDNHYYYYENSITLYTNSFTEC